MASYEEESPDYEAPETFKQAFARNRKAGAKTFTWKGKKYTTELASEKKKPQPEKEIDKDYLLGERGNPLGEGVSAKGSKLDPMTGRSRTLAMGPTRTMGADEFMGRMRRVPDEYLTDKGSSTMMRRDSDAFNMKRGGKVKKYSSGGSTSSASKRADGIAQRGKTRGKFV
jgi:hypothetical protein